MVDAKDTFAVSGFTPLPAQCVAPARTAQCPVQLEAFVTAVHSARGEAPFVHLETRKPLGDAERAVLHPSGTRFDVGAGSPLFYVSRHAFGQGSPLGARFRAAREAG